MTEPDPDPNAVLLFIGQCWQRWLDHKDGHGVAKEAEFWRGYALANRMAARLLAEQLHLPVPSLIYEQTKGILE